MNRLFILREILLPAFVILLAFLLQQYSTFCGVGFTNDSHMFYLAGLEVRSDGFFDALAHPTFTAKPPVYPLLLSLVPLPYLAVFNGICLTFTLTFIYLVLHHFFKNYPIRILCFIFISLGTPFFLVHSFAWTEPPFLVFVSAFFYTFYHFQRKGSLKLLLILSIIAAFFPLIRHAGFFLIVGAAAAFCLVGEEKFSRKIMNGAIFFLIAGSTFFVWNLVKASGLQRRLLTLKQPVVENKLHIYSTNLINYLDQGSVWVMPLQAPFFLKILSVFFLIIIILVVLRKARAYSEANENYLKAIAVLSVVYYFLMHTMFRVPPSTIERYLVPLFPVFALFLFSALELAMGSFRKRFSLGVLFSLASLILLFYPMARTWKNIQFFHERACASPTLVEPDLNFPLKGRKK